MKLRKRQTLILIPFLCSERKKEMYYTFLYLHDLIFEVGTLHSFHKYLSSVTILQALGRLKDTVLTDSTGLMEPSFSRGQTAY